MVPCNFTPSPDPECDPDADRRCRPPMPTGRRAGRRAAFGRTSCVSGRSRRTTASPENIGDGAADGHPGPIRLRNRKACRSVDDKMRFYPINFLYILAFDDHFVEPGLARSRQPYRLCAGFHGGITTGTPMSSPDVSGTSTLSASCSSKSAGAWKVTVLELRKIVLLEPT